MAGVSFGMGASIVATVLFAADPLTAVTYNLVDGRVSEFTFNGSILYNEIESVNEKGALDLLAKLCKRCGFDKPDKDGNYRAFIYWMQEQGLLQK